MGMAVPVVITVLILHFFPKQCSQFYDWVFPSADIPWICHKCNEKFRDAENLKSCPKCKSPIEKVEGWKWDNVRWR